MKIRRLRDAATAFLFSAALVCVFVGAGFAVAAYASGNPHGDKVTICHAAGRAGTTHFETLTIGHQAVYGPGGHFNENGTTQAGHEQDYLGPCQGDETETEPTDTTPTETTPTETTPTETTPTTPTPTTPTQPRCPAGEGPYDGKDGDEAEPGHNEECCPDLNNNQICDYKESGGTTPALKPGPTATTAATTPQTPAATPPAVLGKTSGTITKTKVVKVKKAKAAGKLTGNPKVDRCRKENGLFECQTSTGKKITVVPGRG